jgi:hypothetical protein
MSNKPELTKIENITELAGAFKYAIENRNQEMMDAMFRNINFINVYYSINDRQKLETELDKQGVDKATTDELFKTFERSNKKFNVETKKYDGYTEEEKEEMAKKEAALKAADLANKKEVKPAKTTDDLPTPKHPTHPLPELGSVQDAREMEKLRQKVAPLNLDMSRATMRTEQVSHRLAPPPPPSKTQTAILSHEKILEAAAAAATETPEEKDRMQKFAAQLLKHGTSRLVSPASSTSSPRTKSPPARGGGGTTR